MNVERGRWSLCSMMEGETCPSNSSTESLDLGYEGGGTGEGESGAKLGHGVLVDRESGVQAEREELFCVCVCVCMYVNVWVCVRLCACACRRACVHAHADVQADAYACVCHMDRNGEVAREEEQTKAHNHMRQVVSCMAERQRPLCTSHR